jgi:hypothetical protein
MLAGFSLDLSILVWVITWAKLLDSKSHIPSVRPGICCRGMAKAIFEGLGCMVEGLGLTVYDVLVIVQGLWLFTRSVGFAIEG